MKYVAPQFGLGAFTCPYCGVLAAQESYMRAADLNTEYSDPKNNAARTTICTHCKRFCLWHLGRLVYPNRGNAPQSNPDMPDDVKKDYNEAAAIVTRSPRGAAALLRLAIQKLCAELGGTGENINEDIKLLVQKGLPEQIQKSLDIVRVIGNNAVHPGQIDVDDTETVAKLFALLNIIVEYMISMPGRVEGLYSSLPKGAKAAIDKRDNQTN